MENLHLAYRDIGPRRKARGDDFLKRGLHASTCDHTNGMIAAVKAPRVARKAKSAQADPRFVRRTVTLPPEVDAEISSVAGAGKFSAFVLRAVSHELQRERIETWLAEREAARGGKPLDAESVAFAEAAWRRRK